MRILFVDSVHALLAERLSAAGHSCVLPDPLTDEAVRAALPQAEGIVVRSRILDADLLALASKLRFVGRVGAGLENVDRVYCSVHGIAVINSPEGNRDGVGELCVAQTLALLKNTHLANAQVHQGVWEREGNRGHDLFGSTVGIIGFGHMGRAFAEKLSGFGVRILAHDKYVQGFGNDRVEETTLEQLLKHADIISLHLPLTPETRRYANADFFGRWERRGWFLNTSRGGVVHTRALLDALDTGTVRGAALDVLEFERPDLNGLEPTQEPETQHRLREHPAVLLTPHIAGVTHEGKVKMAEVLATKILERYPDAHT